MVLSLVGAAGLLATAGMLLVSGLLFVSNPSLGNPTQAFMMAGGLGGAALLLLPSAWYAWRRMSGRPPTWARPMNLWLLTLVVATLLPIVFVVGHLLSGSELASWLVLPFFNLIAVGLPILWLIQLGKKGLDGGTAQRQWGVFAASLALTPLVIVAVELAAFLLAGLIGLIYAVSQPGVEQEILFLIQRLRYAPPSEEMYLRILGPYLSRPGIILAIFFGVSVIAPLVEETLKPLAVWLLAGRKLSPVQGYVAGMLSGAAFALFENLSSTSTGGAEWAVTAASRATTAGLHILASGLVGYGLASAWKHKNYLRLGLAYGVAITLHGLWNGLAVLSVAGALSSLGESFSFPEPLPQWGTGAMLGMGLLAVLNLAMLAGFPLLLQREQAQHRKQASPAPLVPPSIPLEDQ